MIQQELILNNYLFAPYTLELYLFFTQAFSKLNINNTKTPLQVFYGQPREAFRYQVKTFNGKVVMPLLNYFLTSFSRNITRERFVHVYSSKGDPVLQAVPITRSPMFFDITYSCNLWTNSYRERDYIIHLLSILFPLNQCTLIHYPNSEIINNKQIIYDRNEYLLMTFELEDTYNDETNIESLEMQEVRDKIKTTFNIKSTAIVSYPIYYSKLIQSIKITSNTLPDINYEFPEILIQQ